ncbi:MAG TPA: hypothetical protein VJJ52_05935 [Candidatus Nanoarchaeia archaeon]|nr:hypothetical protein [Candidatus Nanoarchaeia archaeon]
MPDLEQKSFQKRQVAYKVWISDILNSNFMKDETSAGYIKINEVVVSRANLIATVVYKADQEQALSSVMIDDGTGKILLKSFETFAAFSKVDIGDMVLVVGRVREFGNEKYIMPEILKKLNDIGWMAVRKLELKDLIAVEQKEEKIDVTDKNISVNAFEQIYTLIKKLDLGDGADIDTIIKNSSLNDTESTINRLLENGDIFEIKPGRVKVLE